MGTDRSVRGVMDFTIPDELVALRERTERFVREEILPREADNRQTPHGPTEEFRGELVALARAAGLLSPHGGREWGGPGVDPPRQGTGFEGGRHAPLSTSAVDLLPPGRA